MAPSDVTVTTDVHLAVDALRHGGLVAMPTETVYGLGADARDPAAVRRIYQVKGRPAEHPVIVHVASAEAVPQWADRVPDYAYRLAQRYWPGPLTLVLTRAHGVGNHVTGGLDSVGLRCPAHPLAQELLGEFDGGVAAPSANRFGRVSPTSAAHVLEELGERLVPDRDVVLDGGPCQVGLESTIVDCTGAAPRVLRPGAISAVEITAAVGGADAPTAAGAGSAPAEPPPRVPGSLASHYAPRARVLISAPTDLKSLARSLLHDRLGPAVGLIAPASIATPAGLTRLGAPEDPREYARTLYAALRRADAENVAVVVAVPPPDEGIGHAVRDRLRRAAHPV